MNQRYSLLQKTCLASLLVFSLGSLLWGALWPIQRPTEATGEATIPLSPNLKQAGLSSNQLAAVTLSDRRLQGWSPVANEPISASTNPTQSLSSMDGVRLAGTVIETGHTYAMLVDRHGTVDLQPAGAELLLDPAGIQIESIAPRSVVLSFRGKKQELLLADVAIEPSAGDDLESGSAPSLASEAMEAQTMDSRPEATRQSQVKLSLEEQLDWLNGSPAPKPNGQTLRGGNGVDN